MPIIWTNHLFTDYKIKFNIYNNIILLRHIMYTVLNFVISFRALDKPPYNII